MKLCFHGDLIRPKYILFLKAVHSDPRGNLAHLRYIEKVTLTEIDLNSQFSCRYVKILTKIATLSNLSFTISSVNYKLTDVQDHL